MLIIYENKKNLKLINIEDAIYKSKKKCFQYNKVSCIVTV
jgi:hypothetical protein